MIKIAPSLLAADFSKIREEIEKVEEAGADMLHIDIMDGHFVPNLTMGPFIVEAIRKITNLFLDVHLMLEFPEKFFQPFVEAGADNITFHIESRTLPQEGIDILKELKVKKALSVNPNTPIERVYPYINSIDMVLIMTVYPGFGGQKFIESCCEKIKKLRAKSNIDIQVDGGINLENIEKVVKAGANIIVAGTSIFKASDPSFVIKKFKEVKR